MSELAVCTIVTKNYLPYARSLASSLAEHNPGINLYVLLADRIDGYFDPYLEPFKFIYLEDLPDQDTIKKMCFYYTPFELCCALRGFIHEYMYENKIADSWLFLDSDILIFSPLDEIFRQLEKTSILLNPHLLKPLDEKYVKSIEATTLVSGIYNAGFLGLRVSEETKRFIAWFKDRLTNYSFNRRGKGISNYLFVDQLWLNFVPIFFKEVSYLVISGANLAYWNLISGKIIKQNNKYYFNDNPIVFIHFTGWDIYNPSRISKHLDEDIELWHELGEIYQKLLFKYGYEECKEYPYAFSRFVNGKEISPEMRLLYYEHISDDTKNEINPFLNQNFLAFKKLQSSSQVFQLSKFKKLLTVLKKIFIK